MSARRWNGALGRSPAMVALLGWLPIKTLALITPASAGAAAHLGWMVGQRQQHGLAPALFRERCGHGGGSGSYPMSLPTQPPSPTPLLTGVWRAEIHLLVVCLEEAMRKQQGHESEKSLFTSLVERMKAPNQPCLF